MTTARFSRRGVIAATLGAAAATRLNPFVPISARAQTASMPKRLLVVFTPMGFLESTFWPKVVSDGFVQSQTMSALTPFNKKLIYLDGLGMFGGSFEFQDDDNEHGSGMCCAFTGGKVQGRLATNASVDQVVANALSEKGQSAKYKSIALGVNSGAGGPHRSCFYTGPQQPVIPQTNPQAVFDALFRNLQLEKPAEVDTSAFDREKRKKKSVLAAVQKDLDEVCRRMGTEEKDKCLAHAQGLSELNKRIDSLGPVVLGEGCYKPTATASRDLVETINAQMDVVAATFACDLTRVMTLQLGYADGGLDMIPGINHHDTTHAVGGGGAGPAVEAHMKIDQWMSERIAYLLGRLDRIKENQGTLLDNTLVLFGSDTTTAMNIKQGPHRHFRFPFFMAGGSNFAFRTGRYLSYANPNNADVKRWTAHNRLLVSVSRAFGANIDKFGGWDTGSGPLAQL